MTKKLGNINISKAILKGLEGFEDVFEDYVESEDYKDLERKELQKSMAGDKYELQFFLEQENARLTCLEIFLTKKISLKKNFSQTKKLIFLQQERKQKIREKLFSEFIKSDSALQKNLAQFFNTHFG